MRKDTPHAVGSVSSAPAAPKADDPYPGPQIQSIDDEGWTQRYTPYGEQRSEAQVETDYRYTGQREEDGIGLYYYNARWYDPAVGWGNGPRPFPLGQTPRGLARSSSRIRSCRGHPTHRR